MDELIPYLGWLQKNGLKAVDWLGQNVATWNSAIQLILIGGILFFAHALAKRSATWVEKKLNARDHKSIIRIHASYHEIFSLAYAVVILWIGVLVAEATDLPSSILRTVASLATAWGIIRSTSSTIESPFWSRVIALTLWTLAALNIVGWLGPTVSLLNKASINIGDFRLSLLLAVKSFMAFGALLWGIGVISGALERSFTKAQSLTPSQRVLFYKVSNITLYAIAVMIGLNILGLDLTAFTVFSGALGLGIGFGLQKVFANLISGLILLIDKSVKPGDVIALGDTFGWVNSLGARYVSVLTRDGKEHLIPNENLISEQVENWSYSKRNIRIHIPIGVAYGSDVKQVKQLLIKAAKEHPRILKYPEPACLIKGFGDNSIDHEIRAWIDDPEDGISNVKSDIYYRIWELFKENNVEIPFPQRDVHIRSDAFDRLMAQVKTKSEQE